jgi:hypothetical protein
MTKFIALFDLHWGYERKGGHKLPMHDKGALDCALSFMEDFKPQVVILGGDMLDCGVISHHNHGKPGKVEGFRLLGDSAGLKEALTSKIDQMTPKGGQKIYMVGNHEVWIEQLVDEFPGLAGIVDLETILGLKGWKFIPQGGHFDLGKLTFVHGDNLVGGENVAKQAVISYERNIRFGHFHTYQAFTKTSAIDLKLGKTGVAIPCLCKKDPEYIKGRPNRWMQGFNWGYVDDKTGYFNDYVTLITNGQCRVNGKTYGS